MAHFVWLLFLLVSSATACDRCVHRSKATVVSSVEALSSGACGYGSLALSLGNGFLAGSGSPLFKNGAGCGACFQIRCKNPNLCNGKGTKVTLTGRNYDYRTDFVLSRKTFMAMANKGKADDIPEAWIVDVEYKRIPCEYKNQNLAVRVEESSQKPYYLQLKLLYQGRQTEVVAIDVARIGSSSSWNSMNRNYGAVWDSNRYPNGALQFRFKVLSGYGSRWIWAKYVLPSDWKNGVVYDTGVQITDIARENCSPCDYGTW